MVGQKYVKFFSDINEVQLVGPVSYVELFIPFRESIPLHLTSYYYSIIIE